VSTTTDNMAPVVVSHSPVVGIAGWKNSGKTTLTCRLVEEFTRRGLRVATIKHAHHTFTIDDEATDSARHRRAGAAQVAIVSSTRMALITELTDKSEPSLEAVIAQLSPCDLILIEGYKRAGLPKIEARRAAQPDKRSLAAVDPWVVAIAADGPVTDSRLPTFGLNDIAGLADFIANMIVAKPAKGPT
jgi:molybdopterin-guanine dinucleotide biosynthesis adapter protein